MAEINHAWQVLGDPAQRRDYDLGLSTPTPSSQPSPTPASAEPAYNPLARYQDPPRFPWRMLAVMGVIGTIVVMIGVATESPPRPPTVDNILRPGDCVAIQPNGDAAERLCTEPHDGVVEEFLAPGALCPEFAEPHRDQQGLGTVCVRAG